MIRPVSTDRVIYSPQAVRSILKHWVCCEGGACDIARTETVRSQRPWHTDGIPSRVLTGADITHALKTLWPETFHRLIVSLPIGQLQGKPPEAAAVWALIQRGPYKRPVFMPGSAGMPHYGRITWAELQLELGITRKTLLSLTETACKRISEQLGWSEEALFAARSPSLSFYCTPERHVFGVGGEPHPAQRCRCGRKSAAEWSIIGQ